MMELMHGAKAFMSCMEKAKSDLIWSVRKVLTFSTDCHYFFIFLNAKIV